MPPDSGGSPGICGGKRCIGGSNNGTPCTQASQCASGSCGRPGTPTRPSACVDDTLTPETEACTPSGDGLGTCAYGPVTMYCSNHPNRACSNDAYCDDVPGACTIAWRPCYSDNGMLGAFGETLVVDWGLTKVSGRHEGAAASATLAGSRDAILTQAGFAMGTAAYMSPEQAAGEVTVDGRSDLYSLGAVAFFALTGRPPFGDGSVGRLLSAHLTQQPPRADEVRAGVPGDLADVIGRCLAKAPADRYQTAAELDAALAACGCAVR